MRRICMFLCLSLFVSLIHASSLTAQSEVAGQSHAEHMIEHNCHNQVDAKVGNAHTTSHQTHHQCCLGILADLSRSQYVQPDFSNYFIALVPQLIVEAVPSHIFKPPRLIS